MTKIEFSAKETASLQAHFAREKERLTAELSHVELMLSKLGAPAKKKTTKSGHTPKKRGPKSIWGAFILKRLRARNRPMSYDELIADAMSIHKIPEARLKSAKASILNSAFPIADRAWKDCHGGSAWEEGQAGGVDQVGGRKRRVEARARQSLQSHHGRQGSACGHGSHSGQSLPRRRGLMHAVHGQEKRDAEGVPFCVQMIRGQPKKG